MHALALSATGTESRGIALGRVSVEKAAPDGLGRLRLTKCRDSSPRPRHYECRCRLTAVDSPSGRRHQMAPNDPESPRFRYSFCYMSFVRGGLIRRTRETVPHHSAQMPSETHGRVIRNEALVGDITTSNDLTARRRRLDSPRQRPTGLSE